MSSRRNEIIEAVRGGERRSSVARRLGVDLAYVSRVCTPVLGKSQLGKPRTVDYAHVRRLYDAGHSDAEIARQVGCYPSTVLEWRRVEGLPVNMVPSSPRGMGDLQREAVDLVKGGMTYRQTAAKLGVGVGVVSGACHRAGLKTGLRHTSRKGKGGTREGALRAWETKRNKAAAAAIAAWVNENATDLPHSDGG